MTINAARLLGVEKERGSIAPRMAADIVAVRGDPLSEPRVLKQVHFVMKNGKVVKQQTAGSGTARR
jgi:imidazolonepropionase-like amidohydrolase